MRNLFHHHWLIAYTVWIKSLVRLKVFRVWCEVIIKHANKTASVDVFNLFRCGKVSFIPIQSLVNDLDFCFVSLESVYESASNVISIEWKQMKRFLLEHCCTSMGHFTYIRNNVQWFSILKKNILLIFSNCASNGLLFFIFKDATTHHFNCLFMCAVLRCMVANTTKVSEEKKL